MAKTRLHGLFSRSRINFSLLCAVSAFGLVGCNESGNSLQQNVEDDWVNESPLATPPPGASPRPNPSATPAPTPNGQVYTGPAEVEKYVLKFIDDALIQGVNVLPEMDNPKLEIRIASLDSYGSSTIGLCETGSNKRRVTFDPDFWNSTSEAQRELLAHHEFGHCVLNRGHRSDVLATGKYASIMYPIIMSSSTYTNNYDYYQEELFTFEALQVEDLDANADKVHICN